MSMNVELHNIRKITAEACHGENAHWVDLIFEFKRKTAYNRQTSPAIITVFFAGDGRMADFFAHAVNSVNRPHVASNTVELMQQLRDSVALCDEERVP